MQAFESEHKVGIYFFKTTRILDQKWGTSSPIKYIDPVYKFPVALRAFGNFSYRIEKAEEFFTGIVGVAESYSAADFRTMMAARLVQPLTDFFAESGYSYGDIDAKREELSAGIQAKLVPEFEKLGFAITDFRIEGSSFDEKTMVRIDRIADMGAEAQAAAAVGLSFAQMQQLEAMREAARNEGGGAGMGMGLGMGLGAGQALGSQMMQGITQSTPPNASSPAQSSTPAAAPASSTPTPTPSVANPQEDPIAVLKKLKDLLDLGLISAADFDAKKSEVLKRL
jgi:membrane protease subunit (stomatin/prohibitin family)